MAFQQARRWIHDDFRAERELTAAWLALDLDDMDLLALDLDLDLHITWKSGIDRFSADFFSNQPLNTPSGYPVSSELCPECIRLLSFDHIVGTSELHSPADNCPLCNLLLAVVPGYGIESYSSESCGQVHVIRNGSALKIFGCRPRILRLRVDLDQTAKNWDPYRDRRPTLQAIDSSPTGSPPQFQLLREWLRDCDQNHRQCKGRQDYWPTRVIFVGGPDPNVLKLVKKQDTGEDYTGEDYIVLSHCWGTPTDEEKKRFCTTKSNYQHRLQGFSYDDLPKTFQDAVRVTRELQKQYLWIDSLCIIQGDDDDWEKEAGEMENVFASAYSAIAASSAPNWRDGFLEWDLDSQIIEIQVRGTPTYACDFNNDVDEGALSRRAWVLQERVLSRRIIHFAAEQTYWECGEGVRCENFTRLECPPGGQHFILDPDFPHRLYTSGYNRTVDFVRFLFKKYSKCGLTVESDRDTAIIGLVKRIETALGTEARYGIFNCLLGSLLLWKRSADEKTARIEYMGRMVPSWSWMAWSGGIDFLSNSNLKVPPSADLGFSSVHGALIVQVRQFEHCRMEREGEMHALFADTERVGSLWFDMAANIEFGHCVVVGMREEKKEDPQKTYFVLAVRRKQSRQEYERLGVGEVESRYVSRNCNAGTLW